MENTLRLSFHKDPSTLDPQKNSDKLSSQEMPIAPVYCEHYSYLQKPYVQNLAISPIGIVQFDRAVLQKKYFVPIEETHLLTLID